MFIRGGFNVYPAENEVLLAQGGLGLRRAARPRGPTHAAELRACAELASFKRPDGLTVLAELPLTTMFKVDRRALRASRERA